MYKVAAGTALSLSMGVSLLCRNATENFIVQEIKYQGEMFCLFIHASVSLNVCFVTCYDYAK